MKRSPKELEPRTEAQPAGVTPAAGVSELTIRLVSLARWIELRQTGPPPCVGPVLVLDAQGRVIERPYLRDLLERLGWDADLSSEPEPWDVI